MRQVEAYPEDQRDPHAEQEHHLGPGAASLVENEVGRQPHGVQAHHLPAQFQTAVQQVIAAAEQRPLLAHNAAFYRIVDDGGRHIETGFLRGSPFADRER